jgi:hypothetical protein
MVKLTSHHGVLVIWQQVGDAIVLVRSETRISRLPLYVSFFICRNRKWVCVCACQSMKRYSSTVGEIDDEIGFGIIVKGVQARKQRMMGVRHATLNGRWK